MSKSTDYFANEVRQIISSTESLLESIPDESSDRYRRPGQTYKMTSGQIEKFYRIRSEYLKLLHSIPSDANSVRSAIQFVRRVQPHRGNIESILIGMRVLLSDLNASLLNADNSSGNGAKTGKLLLLEALKETELLQSPYADDELDRVEQLIYRAIRLTFGSDSPQMKSTRQIFHLSAGVVSFGGPAEERLQAHIEKWSDNRKRLINALQLMPGEFAITEQKRLDLKRQENEEANKSVAGKFLGWIKKDIILAAIIGATGAIIAALIMVNDVQDAATSPLGNTITLTLTPSPTSTATISSTPPSTSTPAITPSITP